MHFVVLSYPRTGSTVIQRAINTSDNFFCVGEKPLAINHLHAFVSSLNDAKTIVPDILFTGIPIDDDRNPVYMAHKVDLNSVLQDLRNLYLRNILQFSSATHLGWKETFVSPYPDSALADRQIKFIRRLFPDILFILNIRNSLDVSRSAIWKNIPNALEELDITREWIINGSNNGLFGDNFILLDHDLWSKDYSLLIDPLVSVGVNINKNIIDQVLHEKLTHLTNVSPELAAWSQVVKRGKIVK